jgi:hypothetical protein
MDGFKTNMYNKDDTAIINPIADADAIDLLISAIKNDKYGTDKVPPPIPISELIDPLAKKYRLPALLR